ncbi:MAG: flagellar export chaperone FliS [Candidatus Desulfofervidaceae bacterium]|nr:flagellar export chaperone FliS [Candidatus Desulfofervidaceae bacterium]MDL1970017.1 flagellar export chaperone FliS [Candidatus Desulfofervidaceae bacterium]
MKIGANVYQKFEEETEPKVNLVVRAYDKIAELLEEAAQNIERNNIENKGYCISRAIEIISELMAALDFEQGKQIAVGLQNIYMFSLNQLMEANTQNNAKILRKIANIFKDLNTAWHEVAKQHFQKTAKTQNKELALNAGL